MKKFKDIEKILRNGKLPDADMSGIRYEVWQKILKAQKEKRRLNPLFRLTPWIWTIASILLILLCIFLMFLLKR